MNLVRYEHIPIKNLKRWGETWKKHLKRRKNWIMKKTNLESLLHWPITKTIQVRRTRHAGHCWRSKDELISDVLLWTPTHGCARVGRPARTYIQQLCEDTGCNPEDLPEAMNDREKWRETVRDIRAGGATWWWWWWTIKKKAHRWEGKKFSWSKSKMNKLWTLKQIFKRKYWKFWSRVNTKDPFKDVEKKKLFWDSSGVTVTVVENGFGEPSSTSWGNLETNFFFLLWNPWILSSIESIASFFYRIYHFFLL